MTCLASRVARLWAFLLAISTLGAPVAFGDQFIVKKNGGGTHTTIQSAINDASDGDEIIVFPATYLEKINFLGKAIFVHGTDPSDPDVVDDTVIDASGAGHVVTFESGEPSSAVLEGFTIQNGSETHGGGIFCINGASPTIRRNVITQNFCVLNGSGVHCSDGASPYIVDNQILENFTEGRGGGVFCESSSARIERNFIAENLAPGSSGGAVHLGAATDAVIVIGNTMIGNLAVFGAGIHLEASDARIERNRIIGNFALPRGGGISIVDGSPTIIDNVVAGNLANIAAGLDCNAGSPLIRNNSFIANWAVESSIILLLNGSNATLTGNIIAHSPSGVGVKAVTASTVSSHYNCYYGNVDGDFAGSAGPSDDDYFVDPQIVQLGTWIEDTEPETILDLKATLLGPGLPEGEAKYKLEVDRERFRVKLDFFPPGPSYPIYINNVIVGQIFVGGDGRGEIEYDTNDGNFPPGFPEVAEEDIVNVGGIVTGLLLPEAFDGVIPLLTWEPGDEHLQSTSPCIGGYIGATFGDGETDIDGQVRSAGAAVDVGADEFIEVGTGDFDGDGHIDMADVALFQRCMGNGPPAEMLCRPGDFDDNTVINLGDYAQMQAVLTGPE